MRPKNEVQSAHFSGNQFYLNCAIVEPGEINYEYHLSDDTTHDFLFLQKVVEDIFESAKLPALRALLPYVFSCLTCLCAPRVSCPTYLVPYVSCTSRTSCLTCLVSQVPCVLRASCHACSRVSRVLHASIQARVLEFQNISNTVNIS